MINEFITHLQGAGLTPNVRFAFTANPIEDYDAEFPVIMVYPLGDEATPNEASNLVVQASTAKIVCLLGCEIADYEALRDELRAAAIGWVHGHDDALELWRGDIEGLKGKYIWWRDTYTIQIQIRQTA